MLKLSDATIDRLVQHVTGDAGMTKHRDGARIEIGAGRGADDALTSELIGERQRGFLTAPIHPSCSLARLGAFRRVNTSEPDAPTMDFDRVAVDGAGAPGSAQRMPMYLRAAGR